MAVTTYQAFRGALATLLGTLAITDPSAVTIKRAYEFPPDTIEDLPAAVIFPPSGDAEYHIALREKTYRVPVRILVSDADVDKAAEFVDAWREALIDLVDQNVSVTGTATKAWVSDWSRASSFDYAGRPYVGLDVTIDAELKQARNFAA